MKAFELAESLACPREGGVEAACDRGWGEAGEAAEP